MEVTAVEAIIISSMPPRTGNEAMELYPHITVV